MKKNIILVLSFSSFAVCFAGDVSQYQNIRDINEIKVTQPTIVEIRNLDQSGNYMVTNDKGSVVQQQSQGVKKSIPPEQVEACTNVCASAPALADNNESTTFDFPLLSSGIQKGKIKIVYAKPLMTDSIMFRVTGDSYMPTAFTLMINGKRILNTTEGGSARFPRMIAQSIEVEFDYNQPIRFTEVGVGSNDEVSNVVRFVYQPETKYSLYLDSPLGGENIPHPAVNLFSSDKVTELTLGNIYKNSTYKEKDTDGDGIPDSGDNCPRQINIDQKDGNGNGIGDVCDDYDYDGVSTYIDNCPTIANPDQKDTDQDGIGDTCDKEESRITEKYAWMPWVVFMLVFLAVGGMGYEVMKNKKA